MAVFMAQKGRGQYREGGGWVKKTNLFDQHLQNPFSGPSNCIWEDLVSISHAFETRKSRRNKHHLFGIVFCYFLIFCMIFGRAVDVMYSASNKDNTTPGASGEVQDHQEHHQDDQEQLQGHFYKGFKTY